ncbi:MAG TPA: DUF459 domain-containing protein [Salinarimonas sp.]|nr:DUF459 domain-containing protein [Salinarimonas sp.]
MRLTHAFGLAAAALAVLLVTLAGAPEARAQWDDVMRPRPAAPMAQPQPRRQQTYRPSGRQAPYGYGSPYGAPAYAAPYGYAPPRAYAPPPAYYGRVDPYYDPRRDPRYGGRAAPQQRKQARRRPPPVAAPAPTVAQPAAPEPRKQQARVEVTARLAMFGDALADTVADGLADAFEDAPEIEVLSEARPQGGLARAEPGEWPKIVRDTLDGVEGGAGSAIGLVMLGLNDRQPIREGDQAHEPLSERWRQLYAERVDAVTAAFAERKVPLIWIGAPPMRAERGNADLIAINDIARDRVQRAGGVYVDIWPGFVDDENRYTATGPDHRGQTARLRAGDGIAFTEAGARTAAEFAVNEIRRVIERRRIGAPAVAGQPQPEDPATRQAAIDRMIDSAVEPPAPTGELAALPAPRPLAGPVVPLTRPEITPGGTLASSRPALEGETGQISRRALEAGVAPTPRPGRADDFRWPKP